jgi:hypothetical protein
MFTGGHMSAVLESDTRIPGARVPDIAPGRVAAIDILTKCKPAEAMFCTTDQRRETLIELLAIAFTLGRISGLKVTR